MSKRQTLAALLTTGLLGAVPSAQALVITANFDASITGNANAAAIESSINQAIGAFQGLYSNAVTLSVNFTYNSAGAGNLLSTNQFYQDVSYSAYVAALQADATAHPTNTVLATALANLSHGNDANGSKDLAIPDALYKMLGFGAGSGNNPVININSIQPFAFNQPADSSHFDLIGGLEHELDEVLGGGGGGSTLGQSNSFFTTKVGALDLYRYSGVNTPSFTTSSAASSYLSVDGGVTSIAGFNQQSGGDYADFAPQCSPAGAQLIQNAFNCMGAYEAYTSASPEFAMMESIGWDARSAATVPEPTTIALESMSLALLIAVRRRKG